VAARIDGRRLSHEASAAVRRLAVQRVARGERPSAVIARYGMCRTTIYRWLRAARAGGLGALRMRRHPGYPPRVDPQRAAVVRDALLAGGPAEHGLPGALWTRRTVAALVERRTGVRLGPLAAGRLVRRIGLDPFWASAAAPDESAIVVATDGRGSFLCARVPGSGTAESVRRTTSDLQRRAGRRVKTVLLQAS
jgi:transposase